MTSLVNAQTLNHTRRSLSFYHREPNWPPGMPRAASRCGLPACTTCQPKPGCRRCTHLPWRMHQPHSGSRALRQLVQSGSWGQAATGTRSTWTCNRDRSNGCGHSGLMYPDPWASPHLLGSQDVEVAAAVIHQQVGADG